ncbi:hypothetical protein DFH08DRAFT_967878 [Mycena albidolilacea]|uniref:Uncharacterized protein n=1 Tax=Mycena albidolilacea TaxID=1033008 RepID=A0AAD6ZLB1_9AGAR|nr:hypothetical protein DFH08DRAFT_967878 [Mycena albidolilacea]
MTIIDHSFSTLLTPRSVAMPPPMPSQVRPQLQTQPRAPACVLKPPRPSRTHTSRPSGRAAPPALSARTVPCGLQRCPAPPSAYDCVLARSPPCVLVRTVSSLLAPSSCGPFSPLLARQFPCHPLVDVPRKHSPGSGAVCILALPLLACPSASSASAECVQPLRALLPLPVLVSSVSVILGVASDGARVVDKPGDGAENLGIDKAQER